MAVRTLEPAGNCTERPPAQPGAQNDGLLVPAREPAALADALQSLLLQPQKTAALAQQARTDALAHYGLPQMLDRYEALFLRLLGVAPSAGASA